MSGADPPNYAGYGAPVRGFDRQNLPSDPNVIGPLNSLRRFA